MKALRILFLIAAVTVTACDNMHPDIDIELRTDYTEILQAIEDANMSLLDKLTLIETTANTWMSENQSALDLIRKAVESMGGTLEEKIAAIRAAIQDQTPSLETKLVLIQTALTAGFADIDTQQALFRDALESLGGTLEEKIALIGTAIRSRGTSLETRLGLIEAAAAAGFADTSTSQGLIAEALEATSETVEGKLSALIETVNSQTTPLSAKLSLIETAVQKGFADSGKKQELLLAAVESLGGTLEQQIAAVEAAMQSASSSLEAKIGLLAAAVEKGIGDQNTALGQMKTALETSIGTLDPQVDELKKQTLEQLDALSGKLDTEELSKLLKDVADAIDGQAGSDAEKLQAILEVLQKTADLAKDKFLLTATLPAGFAADKDAWTAGDVILVFFDKAAAPKHLEMSYDGSSWSYREMNGNQESAGCLNLRNVPEGTLRAFYLPAGSDVSVSVSGTDLVLDGEFPWYLSCTKSFNAKAGLLMGELDLQVPEDYVFFSVPDASADAATQVELREPNLTPRTFTSIAADGSVKPLSVVRGAPLKGVFRDGAQKAYIFGGVLTGDARNTLTDYHFTLVKGGWKGSYSSCAVSATLYTGSADCRVLALSASSTWTPVKDLLPVDMGCDVSYGEELRRVYWSSRNLGAKSEVPSDGEATYGNYYAWGETSPKEKFCWKNYQWSNADSTAVTKYAGDASGVVLNPEDDAATAALGGNWHIPQSGDWAALGQEEDFNWSWNGAGYLVTSKKAGYDGLDGPALHIPAAGFYSGNGYINRSDEIGVYWTSNRYSDDKQAICIWIPEADLYDCVDRYLGLPVRPVTF